MGKIVQKSSPGAKPKRFEGAKQITKKPNKPERKGKGKFNKPVHKGKGKFDKRGKQRHDKQAKEEEQEEASNDEEMSVDGSDFDDEMAQVEAEIAEVDDTNLNEEEFKKFETGELDLPSDPEDDEPESEVGAEEEDLDEYYRELGIDPEEMKTSPSKKKLKKP